MAVTEVRLPRLLDGNMREKARLHPVSQSVHLNLVPLSTASMVLPQAESVTVRDFVELFTDTGSAGVYRVTRTQQSYTGTTSVSLEHVLTCLGDGILAGEGKISGTAQEMLTQMLAAQVTQTADGAKLFAAGECDAVNGEYNYDHTNILTAINEMCEAFGDYAVVCDTSVFPFAVSIRAFATDTACEGRLSRNIEGVQVTYDDSDLCTRIICPQLEGETAVDGPTIGQYGVIVKTITASQNAEQGSLRRYIGNYLNDHAQPTVSIEMNAIDLSRMTGEPLDRFAVGTLCRIAMPDYGVTLRERIISMDVQSAYDAPQRVRLTLKNRLRDTRKDIAMLENQTNGTTSHSRASGGGRYGGGSGITPAKLIDMLFAEDYVTDENGSSYFQSKIDLDAQGIRLWAAEAHIDEAFGRVSEAEASISVNAHNIELKVSKDGVISSINQTAEAIQIQANRIDLSGYVTASKLTAEIETAVNAFAYKFVTSDLWAAQAFHFKGYNMTLESMNVVTSVSLNKGGVTVPGADGAGYYVINTVSLSKNTDTIYYLGY